MTSSGQNVYNSYWYRREMYWLFGTLPGPPTNMSYNYGSYGDLYGEYSAYDGFDYNEYWEEQQSPEFKFKTGVEVYVSPILLLIGSVCNIFSLIILQKMSRELLSSCIYLSILSVVDVIVLYGRCGNDWYRSLTQTDVTTLLLNYNESICKVYPFLFNFVMHLSKWLIVCVAIEGFIAMLFPSKVSFLCSLSRAKAVIMLLTVLLICLNAHFFWSYEITVPASSPEGFGKLKYCTFGQHDHRHSMVFQMDIWPVLDITVAEVLPFILITTCMVIMTVQVCRGRYKGDKEYQNWRKKYTLYPDALDQFKVTILLLCVAYILLVSPKMCHTIAMSLTEKGVITISHLKLEVALSLCNAFHYSFLACKFFIYLATSRLFREEFVKLIKKCRPHGNKTTYSESINPRRSMMQVENGLYESNGKDDCTIDEQRAPLNVPVSNITTV